MYSFLPIIKNRSWGFKILVLILIMAVSLLLTMVLGVVIAIPIFGFGIFEKLASLNDFGNLETISILKYFQVVNQLGVFILPAIFYAYLEDRKPGSYLQTNMLPDYKNLLLSVLLILAFVPAINWMVELNLKMQLPDFLQSVEHWMKENEVRNSQITEAFLNVNTLSGLIVNLIIIAGLAAIGEELLFRGVIVRIFIDGLKNTHLAVIISAVLFSAMHMQFYGFLPRMVLGIVFGYVFVWTGKLWIPIILHFVFNGITVVGTYLFTMGYIETDVENIGTVSNTFIIVISLFLSIVLMFSIYKINTHLTNLIANKKEETSS